MATTTMTASAATSGIELTPYPPESDHKTSPSPSAIPSAVQSDADDSGGDPILQAADSDVPEGGYGWVVVAGCFVLAWWVIGTAYSWGVIQGALVEDGLASPSVLSFVGSLAAALIAALAIVNGRVVRRFGPRNAGLLGVALMGLSEVFSSFSVNNVGALFATSGVMMGLGVR